MVILVSFVIDHFTSAHLNVYMGAECSPCSEDEGDRPRPAHCVCGPGCLSVENSVINGLIGVALLHGALPRGVPNIQRAKGSLQG